MNEKKRSTKPMRLRSARILPLDGLPSRFPPSGSAGTLAHPPVTRRNHYLGPPVLRSVVWPLSWSVPCSSLPPSIFSPLEFFPLVRSLSHSGTFSSGITGTAVAQQDRRSPNSGTLHRANTPL